MKILVTGAKGFVGKNLCWSLKNIAEGKDRRFPDLRIDAVFEYDFPSLLHFFTATDTQQVMKREPIFPQHFHNNFICREGKGNKAPKMAFKTL